jgi:hypothetical protein
LEIIIKGPENLTPVVVSIEECPVIYAEYNKKCLDISSNHPIIKTDKKSKSVAKV